MSGRLEFKVTVSVRVHEADGVHVASCPALDVVSQGESHADALTNLSQAIQLFLKTCYEMGTLDDVLREAEFEPAKPAPRPARGETLDIPLPLLARRRHAENHPR